MTQFPSKIITNEEREALTGEKYRLLDLHANAKTQGEAGRIYKEITDIQRQLDDDLNERQRTGYDEVRARALQFVSMGKGSAGVDGLRELCTPGSTTTDLWVRPHAEMTMAPAARLTGGDRRGTAYLTTDTATTGANYFFVPELYKNIVMGLTEASGVLEANPTLIVTDHVRPIQVPRLTADASATAGTEGSEATDANTTGAHVDLGAYRFDGKFTVSQEMLMSSEYDLAGVLETFAVRSIANKVAGMLALGNGTTQPQGVFTASAVTVGKTAASATAASLSELIEMTKALPKGYRKTAHLVTSDVLHTDMVLKTNDDGDYALKTLEGGGEQFCGKPLHVDPWADQTSMSASEVHAVYGDFEAGFFVRMTPMFFRRSDADPLNPEFTFAIWLDSKVVDASALVSYVMAAS